MSAFQIFIITAAFLQLLCQLILKWKNQSKIKHLQPNPPEGINSIMDVETWNKTSNYATEKSRLSNFEEIFSFLIFLPRFLGPYAMVFSGIQYF